VSISPSGFRPPGRRNGRGWGSALVQSPPPPLAPPSDTEENLRIPGDPAPHELSLRKQPARIPSLTSGDPDAYFEHSVSPLPPGVRTHRETGARLSRRRGHKRPPRTQSAWRRVGSYDVLPPLPRPSLLAGCKPVRRLEPLPDEPRSGWHS